MVISSRWQTEISVCSLPKWVFGSSFNPLPDTPQFIDPEQPETHIITRAGYRLWSKRLALGLQRAGLKTGDRVLLFSGNNIFLPSVFMGIVMAGGIFTGANPHYVARELAYQLNDSGASFLVAADSSMEVAMEAAQMAGLPKSRVYSFDATGLEVKKGTPRLGSQHWTELLASVADALKFDWVEPADPKATICCLNYSSGTTGLPKGVAISHYSYIANGIQQTFTEDLDPHMKERRKTFRHLCYLPCYHAYGQSYFGSYLPHHGIPVYVMPSYDFEPMLRYIQEFRISHIIAWPPVIVSLAKNPLARKYDLSSVQVIICGGAPLGPAICDEACKLWPEGAISVQQLWGMTELTCFATAWHPLEHERSVSVGEMTANCKARIMRTDGSGTEITGPDERGELWVTGPTLMNGYWQNPEATAATIFCDPDGTHWMKTGDIGYVKTYAPGAKIHIVDRIKELFKVQGQQVAPAELEAVLLDHGAIMDVAVVAVTDSGEEIPRAYVVPNPVVKADGREIAKWFETRATRYKWLTGGVRFVEAIPKNPSGKILRRKLRELAAAELADRTTASLQAFVWL